MMDRRKFVGLLAALPFVGKALAQSLAEPPVDKRSWSFPYIASPEGYKPTYFPTDVWLVVTPDVTVYPTRGMFAGGERIYHGRTDRFASEAEAQEFVEGLYVEHVETWDTVPGNFMSDVKWDGWIVCHTSRKLGMFGWVFDTKEQAEQHRNTITIQRG